MTEHFPEDQNAGCCGTLHDDNRAFTLVEVAGLQTSPDPLYNGAKVTYWGTSHL